MTPFDFLNEINYGKKNLMVDDVDHQVEKQYMPFIVNKGLSYTMDTVIYANEMNIRPYIDKKLQFDYLINTIRRNKRFPKWLKPEEDENIKVIMDYYGYNVQRAKEVLSLHSMEEISQLKEKLDKGGERNTNV
tara:strand:+ start:1003 stop:1401 length:399 start_codon:yes stop_codon:yes gene_type:complete